jgi:hypothetical protein
MRIVIKSDKKLFMHLIKLHYKVKRKTHQRSRGVEGGVQGELPSDCEP